jgi:hypothetical protein
VPIPSNAVTVDLDSGNASLSSDNVQVFDYGSIPNALSGFGPPAVPAAVSFRVQWNGSGRSVPVRNAAEGFSADLIRGTAQMTWSATTGPYKFVSGPSGTSISDFAEFGRERNGIFFS